MPLLVHLMFNQKENRILGCPSYSEGGRFVERMGGAAVPSARVPHNTMQSQGRAVLYSSPSSLTASGPIGRFFTLKSQNRKDVIFKQ